jgi:uncharacterized protein YbjT (DUF2867 family)
LGEIAVLEEFPEATIIRPSWIYGTEDRFWNKMGWCAKWLPFSFVLAPDGGKAIMRPVYVGDVAAVLNSLAKSTNTDGKIIELYGYFLNNTVQKSILIEV